MKLWKYAMLWILGVPVSLILLIAFFTDWLK